MKPPVRVKVSPYNVPVRFDKEAMAAASANGAYLPDLHTILLAPNNGPDMERETLLHEVIHAVWSQTFLDVKYPDEEGDSEGEAIIRELSPRLLAVLRDNPKLVEYLVSIP